MHVGVQTVGPGDHQARAGRIQGGEALPRLEPGSARDSGVAYERATARLISLFDRLGLSGASPHQLYHSRS